MKGLVNDAQRSSEKTSDFADSCFTSPAIGIRQLDKLRSFLFSEMSFLSLF